MTTERTHFTDAKVKQWLKAAEGTTGRVEYQDDKNPYLRARVSDGKVAWCALVWNPALKRAVRDTFGNHKSHNVEQARKLATEKAAEIVGGVDVSKEKKAKRATHERARATVSDMLDAYIAERAAGRKPLAPDSVDAYRLAVPALLGDYFHKPMDALDEKLMKKLILKRCEKRVGLNWSGTSEREYGSVSGARLGCDVIARLCKINQIPSPLGMLKETWDDYPQHSTRAARLTKAKAQELFAWLAYFIERSNAAPAVIRQARMMQIAMVTGWRQATLGRMRWEHFNFTSKTVKFPPGVMKNRKEWAGPLHATVADILRPLKPRNAAGLVFPNDNGEQSKFKDEFTSRLPLQCGAHDGRKIMSLVLDNDPAVSHYALKMLIAHSARGDVTFANYIATTDEDDRMEAMRAGAAAMDAFYRAKLTDKKAVKAMNDASIDRYEAHLARRRATKTAYRVRVKAKKAERLAAI